MHLSLVNVAVSFQKSSKLNFDLCQSAEVTLALSMERFLRVLQHGNPKNRFSFLIDAYLSVASSSYRGSTSRFGCILLLSTLISKGKSQ